MKEEDNMDILPRVQPTLIKNQNSNPILHQIQRDSLVGPQIIPNDANSRSFSFIGNSLSQLRNGELVSQEEHASFVQLWQMSPVQKNDKANIYPAKRKSQKIRKPYKAGMRMDITERKIDEEQRKLNEQIKIWNKLMRPELDELQIMEMKEEFNSSNSYFSFAKKTPENLIPNILLSRPPSNLHNSSIYSLNASSFIYQSDRELDDILL